MTPPIRGIQATTFGKTAEFFSRPRSSSDTKLPPKSDSKATPVRRRRLSLVTSTEPAVMVTSLLNKLTNPQYATGIRLAMIEHFSLKISRKANVMLQYMSALGADAFHPVPFEQQKAIQKVRWRQIPPARPPARPRTRSPPACSPACRPASLPPDASPRSRAQH